MTEHIDIGNVCIECDELWPCRAALLVQLAAERAARDAAEQERDAAQALAGSLSEELHRVGKEIERYSQRSRDEDTTRIRLNHTRIEERDRADAALAQLAAREQQISTLRRTWDALCRCVDEFEPEDMQACGERRDDLDTAILALLAPPAGVGEPEEDEYRQPCPNGCLGRWGEGTDEQGRPMPVPMYCNVNGCDVESPGMAYKPEPAEEEEEHDAKSERSDHCGECKYLWPCRDALMAQVAALREGLEYAADLLHWDHRPLGMSRAVCDNQHCVRNRALLAQPAAEGERPCLDCGTLLPRESSAVRCMDCVEKAQVAHWTAAEGGAP